jgi:Cu2+-exporting ATPase
MFGDGLNDAPALAAGFVSMSPAGAADISQTAPPCAFSSTMAILRPTIKRIRARPAFEPRPGD